MLEDHQRRGSQSMTLQASQASLRIGKLYGVQGRRANIVATRVLVDGAGVDSGGSEGKSWSIFYAHNI